MDEKANQTAADEERHSEKPQTEKGRDAATLAKMKRRGRLWLAGKILIVLVLAGLGLLVYLQSSHALLHIYLPIASRQVGTSIMADGGGVKFSGKLDIKNLTIMGSDGHPALQAERIYVDIAPMSVMGGGLPEVREARLIQPRISWRVDAAGENNWSFLPKSEPAEKTESGPLPEIRLGHLSIVDLYADYEDASGLDASVDGLDVSVRDIAPGSEGGFELSGTTLLTREEQGIRQQGEIRGSGRVGQKTGGEQVGLEGTFAAKLEGLAIGSELPQSLDVDLKLDGGLKDDGRIEQTLELTATAQRGPVGRMQGDVSWDPATRTGSAGMKIDGVSREFLNPLLAAAAPVQLLDAAIDAEVNVEGAADRITFKTRLNADRLSFQAQGRQGGTPPIRVQLRQSGSYETATQLAACDTMDFDVSRQGESLVGVKLDRPLQLNLGAVAVGQGLDEASARLLVTVRDLTVETARPWLELAGVSDAGGLTGGKIAGDWTVDLARQGESVTLMGSMTGSGLRHAALDWPPLEIRQDLEVALENFNDLKLTKVETRASAEGAALATVRAGGSFRLAQMDGALDVDFEAPAILQNLRRMNLLAGPTPAGVGDGRFRFQQKIRFSGSTAPVIAEGEAWLDGMSLSMRGSQPTAIGAHVSNRLVYSPNTGRLAIEPLRVALTQPAPASSGVVEIKGEWPVTPASTVGRVECSVRGVDLAPWLMLTRALATDTVPPIPVEVDETVERDKSGKLHLKGSVRVGLPTTADAGGERVALAINNELRQWGNRIEELLVEIEATQSGGTTDKIRIEGTGKLGAPNEIDLKATVESFSADPYLAASQLLAGSPGATPAATPPPVAPAPPPLKANVVWEVKQAVYQGVTLTDAAGTAALDNGVGQVKIEKGTLAGGKLDGEASYDMARINPRYAWRMALREANVDSLSGIAAAAMSGKLTGTATAETQGSGEGFGEVLRRHLDGTCKFTIKDGELKGLPVLDKLSEVTQSETFRNLRFFEFMGDLNIEKGEGTIREAHIKGPDNKILIGGTFGMDTSYKVRIDPALSSKLIGGGLLQQYAGVAADSDGFARLPVGLSVEGKGAEYRMRPTTSLPFAGGQPGESPTLDDTLRGVLGGIVEKKLEERAKEDAPAGGDAATTGTTGEATGEAGTTPAPKPAATPKPKLEDQLRGVLGGLLEEKK
jgi:hypothetical protein